jgi:hypothetical protein
MQICVFMLGSMKTLRLGEFTISVRSHRRLLLARRIPVYAYCSTIHRSNKTDKLSFLFFPLYCGLLRLTMAFRSRLQSSCSPIKPAEVRPTSLLV